MTSILQRAAQISRSEMSRPDEELSNVLTKLVQCKGSFYAYVSVWKQQGNWNQQEAAEEELISIWCSFLPY